MNCADRQMRIPLFFRRMNRQARKAGRRTRINGERTQTTGQEDLDHYLAQILVNVSQLLLRNGYGFRRFNRLARRAFVEAAVALDADSQHRTSIARIAAITGLTRIEVSNLRRPKVDWLVDTSTASNRAIGVARGWCSDPRYLNNRKSPKQLPFASTGSSFTNLVKKYSKDIPARAMLVEMKRLRMVKEDSRGLVHLVRSGVITEKSTIAAMRAISPWVGFFGKAGVGTSREELTSTARQLHVHFESLPQVYAAVREIEERRASFVAGLEHLGTRPRKEAAYELTISVAVAAEKPRRTTRTKKLDLDNGS